MWPSSWEMINRWRSPQLEFPRCYEALRQGRMTISVTEHRGYSTKAAEASIYRNVMSREERSCGGTARRG